MDTTNPKKLSDGSVYCEICGIYYPPYLWRNGKHKGTKRCQKALAEKPNRDKAMNEALSIVNKHFRY